jgi:uridine phosphorylase
MSNLSQTELILNPDGSIYHLNLLPGDIADNIILAGDPDRVSMISSFFDSVEVKKQKREFITHTGYYRDTRITVVSSGIGTDNIDIVINELDALANIDMDSREVNEKHRALNFIRIGTSGALQADIPVDSLVISAKAIGFDGLLNFYEGRDRISDAGFEKAFMESTGWNYLLASPYVVDASEKLFSKFSKAELINGITISTPGFYGPQGRELRLKTADRDLNNKISRFRYGDYRITNYEMECSAIYGLSKLLGHEAVTICAIIANRSTLTYSTRHQETMSRLIKTVLDRIAN